MLALQGKSGVPLVLETHLCPPGFDMAVSTLGTEKAFVRVILLVAPAAGRFLRR